MNRIEFTVYGQPVPQGRPRACVRGKYASVYDPKTSKSWKQHVGREAIVAMGDRRTLLTGPLSMKLDFYFVRPKAHFGAKGLKPSAPKHHTKTPDLDNLAKAVKDGLKGICYVDDAQICNTVQAKRYGDRPRVMVTITELDEATIGRR